MRYVGLAFSASMLKNDCNMSFKNLSMEQVKDSLSQEYSSCCNPTHKASLDALKTRYGVDVAIPATAPKVSLGSGDSLVVLQINGLPRETRQFSAEEVAKATFTACEFKIL